MQHAHDSHAPTKAADEHGHGHGHDPLGPEDFHQPPALFGDGRRDPHRHHHDASLPLWMRIRKAAAKMWIGLYLPSVFAGLAKTFQWMVRPKTTQQYPEVRHIPRKGYRGEHRLKKDDQGRPKCVACFMCATACPAECITIEAGEAPWPDRDKYPVKFEIDLLKCIYCGMCEEACPCDAIELTQTFTQVATSRAEKVYDKERLLSN